MSNARDKANIPALNFSSTGIDDNATSTAITINSSQNVGIGSSSIPTTSISHLKINTNTFLTDNAYTSLTHNAYWNSGWKYNTLNAATLYQIESNHVWYTAASGSAGGAISFSERMRIDSSGKVGIGTSSPSSSWSSANNFVISDTSSAGVGMTILTGTSATATLTFADGTGGGDNTRGGIQYLHSDNSMRLRVNNDSKLTIDSTGSVGIGTTAPFNSRPGSFTVSNAAPTIYLEDTNSSSYGVGQILYSDGNMSWTVGNRNGTGTSGSSEYMRIDSSGNVGIGTTSPAAMLDISNSADVTQLRLSRTVSGTSIMKIEGSGYLNIKNTSGAGIQFGTNNVDNRMTINQNGNIQIGTTTESARLHIASQTTAGTDPLVVFSDATGDDCGSIDLNASANSVAYTTSSDYRLKENVSYDFDATSRLKQLKPARFNFISDANTTVDGFIAHEVQSVVPEAITGTHNEVKVWKEGEELPEGVSVGDNKLDGEGNTIPVYQGIDQSKLVPLLVKTIQELEARITALETQP